MAALIVLYGPDNFPISTAFFDPLTGQADFTVVSKSATEVVVKQPTTGAVTTITGTGFTFDASDNLTGGVITSFTFEQGGSTVGTFSGLSWGAVSFQLALADIPADYTRFDALFAAQPITLDASLSSVGTDFDMTDIDTSLTLIGSDHDDWGRGGARNDLLKTGLGNDTMRGAGGDDTIKGGAGRDVLAGNAGNDRIDGGADRDRIDGGGGNDILNGGGGRDLIDGGSGDDRIDGGRGHDRLDGGKGADFIRGSGGNDVIGGGSGSDILKGGKGADTLSGGAGADTLIGNGGNDSLFGGVGNDMMNGGAGRDSIRGGAGGDTLFGGGGADVFLFDAAMANDVIHDFQDGTDIIDVSALGLAAADITIASAGTDALVTLGTLGTITLTGIAPSALTLADDFIL